MKNLVLGISGLMLLAVQVNAQSPAITVKVAPSTKVSSIVSAAAGQVAVNVNPSIQISTSSYHHTQVDGLVNVSNITTWNQDQSDDSMKSKSSTKSFNVDRNDKINLNNEFGSITIKIWDRNEIKVDADIRAYASTDGEAQKLLDGAFVNGTKDGDLISFKSKFDDRNGTGGNGSRNGKKWRREVKIYLTVYMPATNSLTASQKYGNINLDDFSGPTSLKVEFGNLIAGDLRNSNNYISVQYGKTVLKDVNQAKIRHQFGDGLTLSTIGTLDLDAQYVAVNIGAIKGNAVIKQQFGGGVRIGSVGSLNLDAQYAKVYISNVRGNATAKTQFGGLTIDEIESGCKNFNLVSEHTDVKLGFESGYAANFDLTTNFGSFSYGSNVTARKLGDEDKRFNSTKSYTGQIGRGGAANVNIKAEFGSIAFNK